jgi:seryl-tRNA synthetase
MHELNSMLSNKTQFHTERQKSRYKRKPMNETILSYRGLNIYIIGVKMTAYYLHKKMTAG